MKVYSTAGLTGKRVICAPNAKRIGKVRAFVMHPRECRVIGFTIKRPDLALMFHRKDVFAKIGDFSYEDDKVLLANKPLAATKEAGKACGVSWDECVFWAGMALVSESGELLGQVINVRFEEGSGRIVSVSAGKGGATDAMLGTRTIPAEMILGFKSGVGSELALSSEQEAELGRTARGAILVADCALNLPSEGGVAAAAGVATAKATHAVKTGASKAQLAVQEKVDEIRPAAVQAAKKTDEAAAKGAYALGKQLGKATNMFSAFKEEYKKGLAEDEDDARDEHDERDEHLRQPKERSL